MYLENQEFKTSYYQTNAHNCWFLLCLPLKYIFLLSDTRSLSQKHQTVAELHPTVVQNEEYVKFHYNIILKKLYKLKPG